MREVLNKDDKNSEFPWTGWRVIQAGFHHVVIIFFLYRMERREDPRVRAAERPPHAHHSQCTPKWRVGHQGLHGLQEDRERGAGGNGQFF